MTENIVPCAIIDEKRCARPFCVWMYYERKRREARVKYLETLDPSVVALHGLEPVKKKVSP